jgi:hypothetical protein
MCEHILLGKNNFFDDVSKNNLQKVSQFEFAQFWLQSNDDDKMTTEKIPPEQKTGKSDIKIVHWSE